MSGLATGQHNHRHYHRGFWASFCSWELLVRGFPLSNHRYGYAEKKNTIPKKIRHISSCSVECYQKDGKKGEMKGTGHVGAKWSCARGLKEESIRLGSIMVCHTKLAATRSDHLNSGKNWKKTTSLQREKSVQKTEATSWFTGFPFNVLIYSPSLHSATHSNKFELKANESINSLETPL